MAQRLIDSGLGAMDNIYLSPGTAAYAVALALVVAAGVLQPRPLPGRSPLASVVGAAVVWLLIGLGVAFGVGAWAGRSALPEGLPLGALDAGWLERERQFTQLAQSVFWGWAIAGAILGILVLLVGRRMVSRSAIALTVGAVALVVISASGVMNFVALGMSFDGPERFIEPLRLVGQVLLVGVVLASVGGVHYEPKSPAEVAVS